MFSVMTICHKTSDSKHPMLMLSNIEGNRYFFGKVPEGTQRVLNENGVKLGRLRSIFLTGVVSTWSHIGGLPGLFLTISDATSRGIDVFTNSSKILTYVVATWRYFVFRKGIDLNVLDTNEETIVGDSKTVFFPIKIAKDASISESFPADTSDSSIFASLQKIVSCMFPKEVKANDPDPESYKSDPSENEHHTHVKLPEPSAVVDVNRQKSLSFVIRFLPTRGKFDPVKAKELGIKPGIKYKNLTDGLSVLNEQNELIHPNQVMEPHKSYPKLVIIDIPSHEYLQNTIKSEEWFVQNKERGDETPGLVYHLLGDDIDFRSEEYLQFIEKFPAECQHVISHSSLADDTLVFRTYAIHLLKLKTVMNSNFNLPYIEEHRSSNSNIINMQSLQRFDIDTTGVTKFDGNISRDTWESLYISSNIHEKPSFESLAAKSVLPLDCEEGTLKDKVQIVTLGTGSALPSIHRNVLSNLVRIPFMEGGKIKYTSILLDAGENTLGTLLRNYGHNGQQQLKQIFGELSLIYLSHLHADHHLGVVSIISRWFEENANNQKKLYLIIPWQYNHFLNEWHNWESHSAKIDFDRIVYISCEQFTRHPEREIKQSSVQEFLSNSAETRTKSPRVVNSDCSDLKAQLFKDLHINSIQTVRAVHCYWAYSVSIEFDLTEDSASNNENSFKISFSGDTRPNSRFVHIGQNSDLLIHEASLEADLIEEALAKKHTTVVEAVRVAQLMKCRKVILTHFSARFSDKLSFIQSKDEYEATCSELRKYLGKTTNNIFAEKNSGLSFDDIQICYAYDFLTLRLGNLGFQRNLYSAINKLSIAKDSKEDILKEEKENLKKQEKRVAKRMERLAMDKKRKTSSSD